MEFGIWHVQCNIIIKVHALHLYTNMCKPKAPDVKNISFIIIVQGITIHVLHVLIEIFVMSGPSMCLFDMNKITVKILFGYAEMVDVKSLVLIRFCSFSLEKLKTTPS